MNRDDYNYIGSELELFSEAKNWKNYFSSKLKPYIRGNILEVGAGLGSNTRLLCHPDYKKWVCLEPDLKLFTSLQTAINYHGLSNCTAHNGTIDLLDEKERFDAVLYIDVLEHIEHDREEVIKAAKYLSSGGHIVILAPAHQWLFTPFDQSIGHYRRYNKAMLKRIIPEEITIVKLFYLDCIGMGASLANKLLLKQAQPQLKQIKIWDNFMVPLSQRIDPLINSLIGKTVVLIGKK